MLGTPTEETWSGMTQLPDYKPFPLYQPSMSLTQVAIIERHKFLLYILYFRLYQSWEAEEETFYKDYLCVTQCKGCQQTMQWRIPILAT